MVIVSKKNDAWDGHCFIERAVFYERALFHGYEHGVIERALFHRKGTVSWDGHGVIEKAFFHIRGKGIISWAWFYRKGHCVKEK